VIATRVASTRARTATFLEAPTTDRHKVIYAAAGGAGNVIDHLDPKAVSLYLENVVAKLADAVKGNRAALYSASIEVNGTAWTRSFPREFAARRGYDLLPHLTACSATRARRACTSAGTFGHHTGTGRWTGISGRGGLGARTRGFRFQSEAYGTPAVRLNVFRRPGLSHGRRRRLEAVQPHAPGQLRGALLPPPPW